MYGQIIRLLREHFLPSQWVRLFSSAIFRPNSIRCLAFRIRLSRVRILIIRITPGTTSRIGICKQTRASKHHN